MNRSPTDRLLPVAGPRPRPEVICDAKHRHNFVQQSGQAARAGEALDRLAETTRASGADWALGIEALARC